MPPVPRKWYIGMKGTNGASRDRLAAPQTVYYNISNVFFGGDVKQEVSLSDTTVIKLLDTGVIVLISRIPTRGCAFDAPG